MAQSHSFACRWNQLVLINGMEKKETKTAVLCSLFSNLCCLFPLDMFRTTYSKQVPGIVYQVRYLLLSTYCTRHDMYRIDTLYQVRAVGVFVAHNHLQPIAEIAKISRETHGTLRHCYLKASPPTTSSDSCIV